MVPYSAYSWAVYSVDQLAVDWVYYSGLNSADWSVDKRA